MSPPSSKPEISESYLEHRIIFAEDWIGRWTIPNPFIVGLLPLLRQSGVGLADISFDKGAKSVGDTYLNFSVRTSNTVIRVGLDHVTFTVSNPDWSMAPQLVELFDATSAKVQGVVGSAPDSQRAILAFHVTPGEISFEKRTARLVNRDFVGDATFYGLSLHQKDKSLVVDKSLRHEGSAFVRLQRNFPGSATFAGIATQLYEDEVNALKLLGITDVD